MAYTVLARKYRSWTFDELVGQEAVATTLKNAINSRRLHHGYLFCGTRGVGKTSAARILARSLNCLKSDGPTTSPCRECESCVATAEGQDVDVIEIDAASNTGVDNIRELRSNAAYRPARARFKIYIIDEVHMLSTGAFNALLKTLEEPPEHVKFIMATTEPQKVPATIQSRCLRFDFRSIGVEQIAGHLKWILGQEGVQADEAVIRRVARLANGSMRDALSLLDQLLSMGSDRLTSSMVDDILPVPHDEVLTRLIGQIADRDAAGALVSLDTCLAAGYSLERFAESLADQIRTLMLLKLCGPDTPLAEVPAVARDAMLSLCQRFESDAYVYMIMVLEDLRRSVRFSTMGRALMEAGIVRLASAASYASIQSLLDQLGGGPGGPVEAPPTTPTSVSSRPSQVQPLPRPAVVSGGPTSAASPRIEPVAGGFRRPVPPKPAAPPPRVVSPPSSEDVRAATSDPMVREAMDLFDGTLVHVERLKGPGT
ncbi:MAG TPA: DNA polymerase III subunit gamma/tau [Phycisphaerae bacterium]|nr:DNA polymerase III subunit gamma/tau [Phycisphaerae bacterium]